MSNDLETTHREMVPSAFDSLDARRFTIAERTMAGHDTPLGHRCSNFIEQMENYAKAATDAQRSHLKRSMVQTVSEIAEIKGRKALAAPLMQLEEA